MKMPMPGDTGSDFPDLIRGTIIASTEYSSEPLMRWTILVLRENPPYYQVCIVNEHGQVEDTEDFYHIGPAVTEGYAQMGGDW